MKFKALRSQKFEINNQVFDTNEKISSEAYIHLSLNKFFAEENNNFLSSGGF